MKMNKNNLPGTNSIHPRVLKEFESDVVKLLVSVYNLAFKTAAGMEGEKTILISNRLFCIERVNRNHIKEWN